MLITCELCGRKIPLKIRRNISLGKSLRNIFEIYGLNVAEEMIDGLFLISEMSLTMEDFEKAIKDMEVDALKDILDW